ncbi:hypothetical protein B0T17DRAFT_529000 [Bombardia bombarda]|uniref:Uncharacterized protein n=1 Tax=Bombardia bombarda TaxID=252184 RepID=A0AA40CAP5_9PEZI|nr:hypothetical protein B0T17DRAFT_529000 [Bombardia bombarda]
MLDENLPTFRYKPSSDNPLSTILYFTQNGTDPAAEYVLRRADPALPASRNKYAVALCDPFNTAVVYGEVMVEPQWSQPTLSAAELRVQAQSGAPTPPATPLTPDSFTIQLYNPDQSVTIKLVPGGWNKSDSWEFEIPVQTFRMPSTSELDREHHGIPPSEVVPRIMFRWKKDGRLSKDVTCYMCGKNLGGRRSKEPDITIALFKAAKESVVTVYEPNLRRVEVEDTKGLELVLLLGAEIIKDLYLTPKQDVFNMQGGGGPLAMTPNGGGRRKNSRPTSSSPPLAMSGALGNIPPSTSPPRTRPHASSSPSAMYNNNNTTTAAHAIPPAAAAADIDAETRRLQAMVEREEREERERREKRERAEQKRIKKMLEEEDKERRRREAEIAKETERLRKKYTTGGGGGQDANGPPLPPRTTPQTQPAVPQLFQPQPQQQPYFPPPPPPHQQHQQHGLGPWSTSHNSPALPPRPVSAGPGSGSGGPFNCSTLNTLWNGPGGSGNPAPPPHLVQQPRVSTGRRRQGSGGGGGGGLYMPDQQGMRFSGSAVGGMGGEEEKRDKLRKKRSMHW